MEPSSPSLAFNPAGIGKEITPFCTIASTVHSRQPDRSLLVRLRIFGTIPSSCQGFTDHL